MTDNTKKDSLSAFYAAQKAAAEAVDKMASDKNDLKTMFELKCIAYDKLCERVGALENENIRLKAVVQRVDTAYDKLKQEHDQLDTAYKLRCKRVRDLEALCNKRRTNGAS